MASTSKFKKQCLDNITSNQRVIKDNKISFISSLPNILVKYFLFCQLFSLALFAYRNTVDFCVLSYMLYVSIHYQFQQVGFFPLEFSIYIQSCHQCIDSLLLSFQSACLLFLFLASLHWLGDRPPTPTPARHAK